MTTDQLTARERWLAAGWGVLMLAVVGLAGVWLLDGYARAADFFPYRLAQEVHAGHRLVYNPGERALLVLHPLLVLPLALQPDSAPQIAGLIAAAGYGLAGAGAWWLLRRAGLTALETGAALLLWLAAWPLWAGFRSPDPLVMAAILWALETAERGRWRLAGLMAGMAALLAPGGILAGVILGVYLLARERAGRYWQTVGLPLTAWIVFTLLVLTDAAPGELVIAGGMGGGDLAWPGALWIALLFPAVLAFRVMRADRRLWFLALWAAAELAARLVITGGLASVESPALGLAVGAAVVLIARRAPVRLRPAAWGAALIAALALLIVAPPRTEPRIAQDRALGEALANMPGASLAHDRSDALTYALDRADATITRLDGAYSLLVSELLARDDLTSLIVALAPDALYLNPLQAPFNALDLNQSALAPLAYAPADLPPVIVRRGDQMWVRGASVDEFSPAWPTDLPFGADVRLIGYAVDRERLLPGQPVRIRLDWELNQAPPKPIDIYLTMLGTDGTPITSTVTRFPPENWEPLHVSTYQVAGIPEGAQSDLLSVFLSLGYEAATLNQYRLASLVIPPQAADSPVAEGAPLGTLGPVQVVGARITPQDGNLFLELTWSTTVPLEQDYQVFAHLTPPDDVNPAAQGDGPPHGGRYPTNFWQPGELVPDTRTIPLAGTAPGEYVVRVGLYNAAGRLSGDQGDSLTLAQVQIAADGAVSVQPLEAD